MKNLFRHPLLTALLFAALVYSGPAPVHAEPPGCYQFSLDVRPTWISTAAVLPWTGELCVSDPSPGARRLLLYDGALDFQREISDWNDLGLVPPHEEDAFAPVSFEVSPSNALRISLLGFDALWIDADFQPLNRLTETTAGHTERLPTGQPAAIYYSNALLTADDHLVGYGAIVFNLNSSDEAFELGFISSKVTPTQPSPHEPEVLHSHEDNTYYLLGYPFVASNDHGTFAVAMGKAGAQLLRLHPESSRTRKSAQLLGLIPTKFRTVSKIDKGRGSRSEELSVLTQFRHSSSVAGLFGGEGDQLFILTREYRSGATIWTMHEVNTRNQTRGLQLVLPTQADQLTIAPGENFWYIFERQDTSLNEQDISTVLRLPATWFRKTDDSPLLTDMPAVHCKQAPSAVPK